MRSLTIRIPPRPRLRLLALLPSVLLAGCQVVAASSTPPASRLFANQPPDSIQVAGVTSARSTTSTADAALPTVRHIVKRGTLAQSLSIAGRVVPVRSAQLS